MRSPRKPLSTTRCYLEDLILLGRSKETDRGPGGRHQKGEARRGPATCALQFHNQIPILFLTIGSLLVSCHGSPLTRLSPVAPEKNLGPTDCQKVGGGFSGVVVAEGDQSAGEAGEGPVGKLHQIPLMLER